jgi:glucose/arabinose dehydrogenase
MRIIKLLATALLFAFAFSCDDEDTPIDEATINLNLITDGLASPVGLIESPDNSGRLFVVDQTGQIYIIKDGTRFAEPFLNIQTKLVARSGPQDERGLLGLAFHPQFLSNGRFYVFYSAPLRPEGPEGWDHTNYVAEYNVSDNENIADVNSETIILTMDHPQSNHNAGMIAFGPDGYLYISTGDGGGGDDNGVGHTDDWYPDNTGGNGQDITENLLGSILRIDVNNESSYDIPPDNPFVNNDGLDEIFAFGFRNPYRFCFDPEGKVILADAGQELYEEIDVIEKGGNYGWNVKEGAHCFSTDNPDSAPSNCPDEDVDGNELIDPVIEFANSRTNPNGLGNVSIGGYVYQGEKLPSLNGHYLFGVLAQDPESTNGAIFAAPRSGTTWSYTKLSFNNQENGELNMLLLGFGQDKNGEVYVLTSSGTPNSGKVYMLSN